MIIIYKKENALTQLIETFKTSQTRQKGSNRRGARIRLKESARLTLVRTIHAQGPSRRSGHHSFITAAAGCVGRRPGAHAQARIPRGVLSRHQSGQLSAPHLRDRRDSARVRVLPFRGLREVRSDPARVCEYGHPRPRRGGNADDRSSDPPCHFSSKISQPCRLAGNSDQRIPAGFPKADSWEGSHHRAEDFLNVFSGPSQPHAHGPDTQLPVINGTHSAAP